jgi:hypothetical protein
MKKPIPEMKHNPLGEDYMIDAWVGLVLYAVNFEANRIKFKTDTGFDIENVLTARGLMALIDEATEFKKTVIVEWCDWVTENLWGLEE